MPSLIPNWGSQHTILLVDDDPFLAFARKSLLEKRFGAVHRAADAAQALILLQDRPFHDRIGLVIVALRQPSLPGPAFVHELRDRLPACPILVLGAAGEIAPDYRGERVRFLPRHASPEDVLAGASDMISGHHARVA